LLTESDASPLIWNVPKLESECYPWINSFTNSLFLNASEPTNEKLLRVSSSNTNAHEWRNLTSLRVRTILGLFSKFSVI